MNFTFPQAIPLTRSISDIVPYDKKVDNRFYYTKEKYAMYDKIEKEICKVNTFCQWRRMYLRENKSKLCPTLMANMGTGGHNVPLILAKYGIRKLTPFECFAFQGFDSDFLLPKDLAISHYYKQAGNTIVVPVIRRIAGQIKHALLH